MCGGHLQSVIKRNDPTYTDKIEGKFECIVFLGINVPVLIDFKIDQIATETMSAMTDSEEIVENCCHLFALLADNGM